MLTPKQYETRRNELIALLDEALKLDVPEKYAAELKATSRKCKEDQFEIALVGEFQGGKSTTFNALCDGRDISPRGLGGGGLKTSAAVITAQNISDDATKDGLSEWAEVTFRTPYALSFGLFNCLKGALVSSKEFRSLVDKSDEIFVEELMRDDGFATLVRLENPRHCDCIKKALHELWVRWEKNRSAVSDDELDLLRIATLQLRYFGTPEYQALTAKRILPITKFQKLVAFQKDWSQRWTQGENSPFTLEECAFVFIESVLVRLHSKNLARLGCRITDCPGLFANAYDTAVAKRTICNADGVWYLLNGEKQIGEKDLKILRTIKSLGMLEKMNATFNIKGSHEQKLAEIFPATQSVLHNAGIDVELFPYNARLAFLATQGDLLCNRPELFSDLDRAGMVVDSRAKDPAADPKAMWLKMVNHTGYYTELTDIQTIADLHEESVVTVRKESHFDEILDTVEKGAVAKKSRSILVDKGSARAAKALLEYEGVLKVTEDAAEAKENEWREKVNAAKKQLDEFVERASKTLERSALVSGKESLAQQMSSELIKSAIDDTFLDDVTAATIIVLETVGKEFYATNASMEAAIIQELTPVIGSLFQEAIARTVEAWKTPGNARSLSELSRRVKNLCDELHDLWEERHLSSESFFAGFTSPDLSEEEILESCLKITNDIFMDQSAISAIAEDGRRGIFTVLLKDILLPLALGAIGGVLCLPLTIAFFVGKAFWDLSRSPEDREAAWEEKLQGKVEKLGPKIRPELQKAFDSGEFRSRVIEPLIPKFTAAQDEIIGKVNDSLASLSSDFEESHCREPEEMFSKSIAERQEIAARNKRIRTESIQPLRERIEAFETAVAQELG